MRFNGTDRDALGFETLSRHAPLLFPCCMTSEPMDVDRLFSHLGGELCD